VACGMSKGRTVAEVGLWPLKIFAVVLQDFCTADQQAGLPLLESRHANCGVWAPFMCLDA